MDFKERFSQALHAGCDAAALLRIVRESESPTFGLRDAYNVMQCIWQELGFPGRDDGGLLQDNLEFVMEKTWYQLPLGADIH